MSPFIPSILPFVLYFGCRKSLFLIYFHSILLQKEYLVKQREYFKSNYFALTASTTHNTAH